MRQYEPRRAPDANEWLDLDEDERIALVIAHHRKARVQLPNVRLHAAIHVIVENQLAEGTPVVDQALGRLIAEGLDRHEAIHAIASVLMEHMATLLRDGKPEPGNAQYFAALAELTADRWRVEWSP